MVEPVLNILCKYSFSNFVKIPQKFLPFPFKAWFPPRRWAPSPAFVVSDKFGGNYWRFVAQPSSPAMNIKKFWYSSPKFIAQLHELSFMSVKMWGLSMLQVIFVYIFITWNNIFRQKKSVHKKKVSENWKRSKI